MIPNRSHAASVFGPAFPERRTSLAQAFVLAALTGAQIQDVPETMQRLIAKDIQKTMQAIQTQTAEENRNESL